MPRYKSIGEKLKQSRNREKRLEMATEWAETWHQNYINCISDLQWAYHNDHHEEVIDALTRLRDLNQPKFEALPRVIHELVHPTRELIDNTQD